MTKGFKVTWKKISGASGYQVWRSGDNGRSYIKAKTVKGENTTTFTNTASAVNKSGQKFKYKIRAYKTANGKTTYSAYSPVRSVYRVAAPSGLAVSNAAKGFKVTWNKVSGVTGYQVWRSENNGKSYIKAKTIRSAGTTRFTNSADAANRDSLKYKYKVRAYKVVSGKTHYSAYSPVKACVKKYGSPSNTVFTTHTTAYDLFVTPKYSGKYEIQLAYNKFDKHAFTFSKSYDQFKSSYISVDSATNYPARMAGDQVRIRQYAYDRNGKKIYGPWSKAKKVVYKDDVFCPNCGNSWFTTGVGIDGFTCSKCGHKFKDYDNIFCPKCGHSWKNFSDYAFTCSKCGHHFEQ